MDTPDLAAFPMLTGRCIDDRHPEREGFYHVEYSAEEGDTMRCWAESLQGVRPQIADRLLLTRPSNCTEPLIVGIIGAADAGQRTEKVAFEIRENNVIVLKGDVPIQVVSHDGRKLVEIGKGPNGPTIRICQKDATLDLPGTLSISAGELNFQSRGGDIRIDADKEVIVRGDLIRLN